MTTTCECVFLRGERKGEFCGSDNLVPGEKLCYNCILKRQFRFQRSPFFDISIEGLDLHLFRDNLFFSSKHDCVLAYTGQNFIVKGMLLVEEEDGDTWASAHITKKYRELTDQEKESFKELGFLVE